MSLGGLHMLGAIGAGDGLRNQTVTLNIVHIDKERLKQKLAEGKQNAAIAPLTMLATDNAPKALFDVLIPLVKKQIADYGVEADLKVLDTPPAGAPRAKSEFWWGSGIGTMVGAVLVGVGIGGWKFGKWLST